jgi:mercuric ion binding protein
MKMKKFIVLFAFVLLFGVQNLFAESKTEKFKVYGNCDLCKKRIETAASMVEGVSSADWNKETKMMAVVFDAAKTDMQKVGLAVATVGHDSEMQRTTDAAYNKLPSCCKYDRAPANAPVKARALAPATEKMKMNGHEGHSHMH